MTPLHITDWDAKGRGVGEYLRHDGRRVQVAVPGSIVGETVEVLSLSKNAKGRPKWVAREFSLLAPSPHRTTPRCPHVGECGGCVWQHMVYAQQLEEKHDMVRRLFAPMCATRPIIGCDEPWYYRNKMEFSFSQDLEGHRFLGLFHAHRRRCVLDLDVCFLAGNWMVPTLHAIREWWHASSLTAYRPSSNSGSLICVTMRESATLGDRMVILTVSGNPDYALKRRQLNDFVAAVRAAAMPAHGELSVVLRIRQIAKNMPTQIYEMMLAGPDHIRERLDVQTQPGTTRSLEFHISPQAFFQPNTLQAIQIYSQALQMADIDSNDVVFDLYCGIGVFGMFAALEGRAAVGIELSRDSAYDAKTNAQRLGIANYAIHCGDVVAVVAQMKKEGSFERPSTVIVDPPRAGLMPQAIDEIVSLEPSTIAYVSCNPHTQVKDAVQLMERGWTPAIAQPVDQFPHTMHVENILLLTRGV